MPKTNSTQICSPNGGLEEFYNKYLPKTRAPGILKTKRPAVNTNILTKLAAGNVQYDRK